MEGWAILMINKIKGLVLVAKIDERISVQIGDSICWVSIGGIDSDTGRVKLVFDAPKQIVILREKLIRSND
jgi:sRNA-binding carbon storage regulator CsrA